MAIEYFGQLPPWVIGAVSQSGGIPTGAIIEEGSNANGSYIRYASGTQICSATITTAALALATAYFGGFRAASFLVWSYPAAFTSVATAQASPTGGGSFGSSVGTINTAALSYTPTSVVSASAVDRTVALIAVGRWF